MNGHTFRQFVHRLGNFNFGCLWSRKYLLPACYYQVEAINSRGARVNTHNVVACVPDILHKINIALAKCFIKRVFYLP